MTDFIFSTDMREKSYLLRHSSLKRELKPSLKGFWYGLNNHMNLFISNHSDVKRDYIPIYKDKDVHPIDPVRNRESNYDYSVNTCFSKVSKESVDFNSKVMDSYFY